MKVIIAAHVVLDWLRALNDNNEDDQTIRQLWSQIITDHDNTYYVISLSWQIIHHNLCEQQYGNPENIIQKLQEILNCLSHEELPEITFDNRSCEYIDAVEGSYMVAYATRNIIKSIVTVCPTYCVSSIVKIYTPEQYIKLPSEDSTDYSSINTKVNEIYLEQLLRDRSYYPPGWDDLSKMVSRGGRAISRRIRLTTNFFIVLIIEITSLGREQKYKIFVAICSMEPTSLPQATNLILTSMDNNEIVTTKPKMNDQGIHRIFTCQIGDRFRIEIAYNEDNVYKQLFNI